MVYLLVIFIKLGIDTANAVLGKNDLLAKADFIYKFSRSTAGYGALPPSKAVFSFLPHTTDIEYVEIVSEVADCAVWNLKTPHKKELH